jgi:TetR/AcrR family transcriptional regulator
MTGRLDEVLDAAYVCLRRSGVRRTSMDDIARQLGTSRTTLYQYVRSTDDAFQRLAQRFLDGALAASRQALESDEPLPRRVARALEVKLDLTARVSRDAPEHAAEFLGEHARLSAGMTATYQESLRELLCAALAQHTAIGDPQDRSDVLLALTRGLEQGAAADSFRLLRVGVDLILSDLPDPTEGASHDDDR